MGRFNEELAKAGILGSGGGLKPSSHGVRVRFSGSATHHHCPAVEKLCA
jgi:hypothetical protein